MKYILAIDQGTTSSRASLINVHDLTVLGHVDKEYPQIYPKPGEVEHNLNEIWATISYTVSEVLKKNNISKNEIEAIGITNQRETVCAFDKEGNPLANAIVWQDRRTALFCQELKGQGLETKIKEITGLTLDPYFSATKINWLLKHHPTVKSANKNNLFFGNIDTCLIYKLTSGKSFVTDATNASRTMLMDLKTSQWSKELLELFKIDIHSLPEIKNSFELLGKTHGLNFLPDGIPITCAIGDQQSALVGQSGVNQGDAKCTYGTGAFMLLNTGENPVYSKNGLLTSVAYRYKNKNAYMLEGSCYIAGAAVQWIRDNLGLIKDSSEIEALAKKVKSLDELKYLLMMPFFTGIGTPHWNSEAKAAMIGITRDTKKEHIAFATLEGIVLSINDLIRAFEVDSHKKIQTLRVDGGAVKNDLLMELQATYSNLTIIRPKIKETTVFGAALGAAIGAGILEINDLSKTWKMEKEILPKKEFENYCQEKAKVWDIFFKKLYLS